MNKLLVALMVPCSILLFTMLCVFFVYSQDGSYSATYAKSTPTLSERIRVAVATRHGCTPSSYSDRLQPLTSDRTGTVYALGCEGWFYLIFVNLQGEIGTVSRVARWNGL